MTHQLAAESPTIALPTTKPAVDASLQIISDYLSEEGFRPKIDDSGSVGFKCEGWKLYLDAYDSGGGFRLYCCVYWELDPTERMKALAVANSINSERRCVKAAVNEKNTVWLTYETHCADEYARALGTVAECLVSACREYREEYRRESQPVTLN